MHTASLPSRSALWAASSAVSMLPGAALGRSVASAGSSGAFPVVALIAAAFICCSDFTMRASCMNTKWHSQNTLSASPRAHTCFELPAEGEEEFLFCSRAMTMACTAKLQATRPWQEHPYAAMSACQGEHWLPTRELRKFGHAAWLVALPVTLQPCDSNPGSVENLVVMPT